MSHVGIKFGRHSLQAAHWLEPEAEPIHLAGLNHVRHSWMPVVARPIIGEEVAWGEQAWGRIPDFTLARHSLLEHLNGNPITLAGRVPQARPLLRQTLWPEVVEVGRKQLTDRGDGSTTLGIATTLEPGAKLRTALSETLPDEIRCAPEAIQGVGTCALVARHAHWRREGRNIDGPVLQVHLGGAEAQAQVWDVQAGAEHLIVHRLVSHAEPAAGVGAVLDRLGAHLVQERKCIQFGPAADVATRTKILRHLKYRAGESRSLWADGWQYSPDGYDRGFVWWDAPGTLALTQEEIHAFLEPSLRGVAALISRVLDEAGFAPDEIVDVVGTGAGYHVQYFLPVFQKLFKRSQCSPPQAAPTLAARGAAALAYYLDAGRTQVRFELRE
jgi:hypothetical protein